ncbi:uncharacterized protein [Argopecten irradians]|uniref:uncharacterized protein n=1 Tax=Argopecten irradians TaxID=31199 RepID=UPI00371E3939
MTVANIHVQLKSRTTCDYHKGNQLEFYCEKCQEPICSKCLSSVHKGHVVCELSEIIPQKKQDIQDFIEKIEQNDQEKLRTFIASTNTLLKDNDSTFEELSNQLRMQTDKLKRDLDMLTAETLSLYQKMKLDNTKLIQKYKQDLEMYEKKLKQVMQDCKKALQRGSHLQVHDTSCEIIRISHVMRSTTIPVKPVLGTANFSPNKTPQGHLELAIGKVITSGQTSTEPGQAVLVPITTSQAVSASGYLRTASSQQSRIKLQSEDTEIMKRKLSRALTKEVAEWKSPFQIHSLCPTPDDQVWTSNHYSETLTLLDKKGKKVQEVTHRESIWDISLSPATQNLWVCDCRRSILELVSGQLLHRFTAEELPKCMCVTADDCVIVETAKNISKFTTHGQMVVTVPATGTGKPVVCSPRKISVCPVTENVAVIDWSSTASGGDTARLVVMDKTFSELFVYTGTIRSTYKQPTKTGGKLFDPRGVVYDGVGNIIVGVDKKIILLSGEGEYLRTIYTDSYRIWALGIGRKDVVWTKNGTYVKLLQYSKD